MRIFDDFDDGKENWWKSTTIFILNPAAPNASTPLQIANSNTIMARQVTPSFASTESDKLKKLLVMIIEAIQALRERHPENLLGSEYRLVSFQEH